MRRFTVEKCKATNDRFQHGIDVYLVIDEDGPIGSGVESAWVLPASAESRARWLNETWPKEGT